MAKTDFDMIELDLQIVMSTPDALLLSDGDDEEWVAKSMIGSFDPKWEAGQVYEIEVPLWLAEKKGWV